MELSGYVFTGGTWPTHTIWGRIVGYWSRPVYDIVREYFPDADDCEADARLWNDTGFPIFWSYLPPERCLRDQLHAAMLVEDSPLQMSYCCGCALHNFEMGRFLCATCEAKTEGESRGQN